MLWVRARVCVVGVLFFSRSRAEAAWRKNNPSAFAGVPVAFEQTSWVKHGNGELGLLRLRSSFPLPVLFRVNVRLFVAQAVPPARRNGWVVAHPDASSCLACSPSSLLLLTNRCLNTKNLFRCLQVVSKGRLGPGQMIACDLVNGKFEDNWSIKQKVAAGRPYGDWIKQHSKVCTFFFFFLHHS